MTSTPTHADPCENAVQRSLYFNFWDATARWAYRCSHEPCSSAWVLKVSLPRQGHEVNWTKIELSLRLWSQGHQKSSDNGARGLRLAGSVIFKQSHRSGCKVFATSRTMSAWIFFPSCERAMMEQVNFILVMWTLFWCELYLHVNLNWITSIHIPKRYTFLDST